MSAWSSLYFVIFAIVAPLTGVVDAANYSESVTGWVVFFLGAGIIGTPAHLF
jgi:nitric oxide reductase large subunit